MLPFLSRFLFIPAHERLRGRQTLRFARELESSQWQSPDAIRSLQRRKLGELLCHAAASTPFYAEKFAAHGVTRETIAADPFEGLSALPLLDKDRIRERLGDMLWHGSPGGLHRHTTGGSTGEPLIFFIDRRRQAFDQAARIRTHRWFGVEPGDRELLLWGSPIEQRASDCLKRFRDRLFNQRLLDAFNLSEARMDQYLDAFDRFRPQCLFGYPSGIARFVEHARRRGRALDCRALKAVFVTGEVCYPHDRKVIEDYFRVPAADGYGSREAGFIAHQCPEGSMHVMAENVIVEVFRDGRPVPVGETGEIVITHLDAWAMPFIRYRTGDTGRLLPGRCRCGRGLPLMDVVQGRTTDFLALPDGTVRHALSIIYPLRELPGISRFRVTQHADYGVTIDVVAEKSFVPAVQSTIADRVRPVLGPTIPIEVQVREEIAVTDSGKFRYVVSHAHPSREPLRLSHSAPRRRGQ